MSEEIRLSLEITAIGMSVVFRDPAALAGYDFVSEVKPKREKQVDEVEAGCRLT
jgi:hypothetical protein